MTEVPPALEAWARRAGSRVVLAEARRRAERRSLGEQGRLSVSLTPAERNDVGILLGISWEAGAAHPSIGLLRKRLRGYGVTLEELLVATGGPILDQVALREQALGAREAEERAAQDVLSAVLGSFLGASVAARCLPAGGSGARLLRAEQLARLAAELAPTAAPIPLAVLAARCFGDAHALDRTAALGRAAARLAALIGNQPGLIDGQPDVARSAQPAALHVDPLGDEVLSAEAWRAAWAAVGVACDRVSSTVLVLNLPLLGSPALQAVTAVPGEPAWLTARTLDPATEVRPAAYLPVVFVCENPSIVESAADRLGPRSAPLVCTYGKPSLAALTLLRALHRCGAQLRVRADNDPTGRVIVASILALCPGALTWRFDEVSPPFEEQLVDDLVADLAD